MSRQQQGKSKDKAMAIHLREPHEHASPTQTTLSHPSAPTPPSFFDKFKLPQHFLHSAFQLYSSSSPSLHSSYHRKSEVTRKHRGNYRKYTVSEKEEAVKQILQGVDAKEISERYGIPRRNLLRWKKNGCERKEGGGRPTDGEMEHTLYSQIDQKVLLTEKDIRNEAKRLSKMADFKASKGWYCKFSRRYNQWKKQERLRQLKQQGKDSIEEKDVFLLPQVSGGSDSDDDDCSDSEESVTVKQQQE